MKKKNKLLGKIEGIAGSTSGAMSFLGSWQVCHNVCLWLITLLSLIGITVVGMPLLFLNKIAVPLWTAAVVLLFISLFFYLKMKCISRNLILLNTGLIIAGIPFQSVYQYNKYFMIIGGIIVALAIFLYFKDRRNKK